MITNNNYLTEPSLASRLHDNVGVSEVNSVGTTFTLIFTDAHANTMDGCRLPILVQPETYNIDIVLYSFTRLIYYFMQNN